MILTKETLIKRRERNNIERAGCSDDYIGPTVVSTQGERDYLDTIVDLESRLKDATEMGSCGKHSKMFNTFDGLIQGPNGSHRCAICNELQAAYNLGLEVAAKICGAHPYAGLILALKDRGAK